MKILKTNILLLLVLSCVSMSVLAQEKEDLWAPREKMEQITMRGTVSVIDPETREITLVNDEGALLTVTAGEEVKRFEEISEGDVIEFDYYMYLKAEFREPTEEELAEPIQAAVEGGIAPEDMDPGAVVGAVVKAVVTIEAMNRPNMFVTVSDSDGDYTIIPVEDAEFLTHLRIGQVVILTYAEAMAVKLEKVAEVKK